MRLRRGLRLDSRTAQAAKRCTRRGGAHFEGLRSFGSRRLEHWHVAKIHWLRSLDAAAATALRRGCRVREYERGQMVFAPTPEPDSAYLLEQGLVRVHRVSDDGEQVTLYYVHSGQIFGELAVIADKARESFAQATRHSVVWCMNRATLMELMAKCPSAALEITKQVAGKMKRIETRVEDLFFRPVRARLARTLLTLAEDFGEREGEWISIDLPITQAELGTLVGATRQSVSDSFGELLSEKILTRDRGRLLLLQPDTLERIAAGRAA